MNRKRIIAIVGATGAQGSGLARAILNDRKGHFQARVITRDPNSKKAKDLEKKGADVVGADIDDLESLKRAFDGAYGAFCVTFFWVHMSPEREMAEALNMAQAAAHAGLKHVIWSTLEDTRKWMRLDDDRMPTLMGQYKLPHQDGKGEADCYFTNLGLPVTFLLTSFYWENFIDSGMGPRRGADGKFALTLAIGDKKLPGSAAEDIGKSAYGIYQKGNDYIGKTVGIAGEHLTGEQMADHFSTALGKQVLYNSVSPEKYRSFGFRGAEDLGNMFQFIRDFNDDHCAARNIELSRELNPDLLNFSAWLDENKNRIPLR